MGGMGGLGRRENSVDACERIDERRNILNNEFNNDIVELIENQPVVNKKKKKRNFSFDG